MGRLSKPGTMIIVVFGFFVFFYYYSKEIEYICTNKQQLNN